MQFGGLRIGLNTIRPITWSFPSDPINHRIDLELAVAVQSLHHIFISVTTGRKDDSRMLNGDKTKVPHAVWQLVNLHGLVVNQFPRFKRLPTPS